MTVRRFGLCSRLDSRRFHWFGSDTGAITVDEVRKGVEREKQGGQFYIGKGIICEEIDAIEDT